MAIRTYTDSLHLLIHNLSKNTTKKSVMAIRTYTDFSSSIVLFY